MDSVPVFRAFITVRGKLKLIVDPFRFPHIGEKLELRARRPAA